eukprot:NODE_360_length_10152_cov_0.555556.p5 type:complete len:150 gc:universal NODE_360_length_10152_cov_0.555556:4530-4979(+)
MIDILVILSISLVVAVSSDCPNMINLAIGMIMNVFQPSKMSILSTDCCSAGIGVTCTNGMVTNIDWSYLALDGIIKGNYLPSGLRSLSLYANKLTGSIPTSFPSGLISLELSENRLTGSIPSTLPNGLTSLSLFYNELTGIIPNTLPYE